MEPAFTIPAANLAFQILSITLMVVLPFAAAIVLRRRLDVGWRIFWLGALVFVVSQMLLRIPLVSALQLALGFALWVTLALRPSGAGRHAAAQGGQILAR